MSDERNCPSSKWKTRNFPLLFWNFLARVMKGESHVEIWFLPQYLVEIWNFKCSAQIYFFLAIFLSWKISSESEPSCPSGYRNCLRSSKCIKSTYWCNGIVDCDDFSDEINCRKFMSSFFCPFWVFFTFFQISNFNL